MMASAAFPAILLFSLCGLLTLALLRTYLPLRSTPNFILFPIFLAILIPCSIILLVPIDLASSSSFSITNSYSRGIILNDRARLVLWRIGYWLCFILTWAILPILQSYSDSGHRSPRKRLTQSLQENARYHLIILTIALIGFIYFMINSGFHFYSLKALVIAISHCYALTLAIYLMGHGLVAIPRKIFRDSSISEKLRSLQLKAPKLHDNLSEAMHVLESLTAEISLLKQRKNSLVAEFQEWIDDLADISGLPEASILTEQRISNSPVPQVITEQYLADATRRLRLALHKRSRYLSEWTSLVQEVANAQAVLDSAASKHLIFPKFKSTSASLFPISCTILTPYTRHILFFYITPQIQRLGAMLLSLASISIVWSELVHGAFPKFSIVGQSIIHYRAPGQEDIGLTGQIMAAAWIAYMCACAFNSMKDVKIWGGYALVPRATSGGSACLYASYACRLTVPLSFNFLGFIPLPAATNSIFNEFLGKSINLTPLGAGFDSFFPIFILFPVMATLLNLYGKVKDYVGFGIEALEDDEDQEQGGWLWREGRDLIDREISGYPAGTGSLNDGEIRIERTGRRTTGAERLIDSRLTLNAGGRRSLLPSPTGSRPHQPVSPRIEEDADTVDEGFSGVGGFLHRVRNTWEVATHGIVRPAWLGVADSGGGRQPRWMSRRPTSPNSGWRRIFGGAGAR